MKQYLRIHIGSRGTIEEAILKKFNNIEKVLQSRSDTNKRMHGVSDDDDEESYSFDWGKVKDGYYLEMGDEDEQIYVDTDAEGFKGWMEDHDFDLATTKFSKVSEGDIYELLNDYVDCYK